MVKPAEDTPLSALALGLLAEQAGFPKGNIYDKGTIHGFSREISFKKNQFAGMVKNSKKNHV